MSLIKQESGTDVSVKLFGPSCMISLQSTSVPHKYPRGCTYIHCKTLSGRSTALTEPQSKVLFSSGAFLNQATLRWTRCLHPFSILPDSPIICVLHWCILTGTLNENHRVCCCNSRFRLIQIVQLLHGIQGI